MLLAGAAAPSLHAQTDYYLRAGLNGSGPLVRDFIVQDVTARQSLGPIVVLGLGRPIAARYGAGVEFTLGTASLHADYGNIRSDLGSMRTMSGLATLNGGIVARMRWRAGLGFLHYFAGNAASLLASGTTRLLVGAGIDVRQPMTRTFDLTMGAGYDFHRFNSPALQSHAFSGAQGVHRVSVSVGLARRLR